MRKSPFFAAVLSLPLIAACSSSHHSSNASNTTSAATSTSTTVPAATTTSSTVAPASAGSSTTVRPSGPTTTSNTIAPGPVNCTTAQLAASLGPSTGSAGTTYYPLYLQNTSHSSCEVLGYPQVYFVASSSGQQVGAPAIQGSGTVMRVSLPPGGRVVAQLGITEAGNYGSACGLKSVPGLWVIPPHNNTGTYVPHADHACSNKKYQMLQVGPLSLATS